MAEPDAAALPACSTCGFTPWTPTPGARCERDICEQQGSSWWHDRGGIHWLVCERHAQPKARPSA